MLTEKEVLAEKLALEAKKVKQKQFDSEKLATLAKNVVTETSPFAQVLDYLKNNPATSTLAMTAAGSVVGGSPVMGAAIAAAAYFGLGNKLDKASGGTQAMAAASAAAFMTGHPVIGAGLGVAAYVGVGKDFFKSAQEKKQETIASADKLESEKPPKNQTSKEALGSFFDKSLKKMSGAEVHQESEGQTSIPRERMRG